MAQKSAEEVCGSTRKAGVECRPLNAQENDEQIFPLLDLPPELWIHCCRLAVITPDVVFIAEPRYPKKVQAAVAQPAITRTCKAIRHETTAYFYENVEFRAFDSGWTGFDGLGAWVAAIWSSWWPHVRRSTVEFERSDLIWTLLGAFEAFDLVECDEELSENGKMKIRRFKVMQVEAAEADQPHGENAESRTSDGENTAVEIGGTKENEK